MLYAQVVFNLPINHAYTYRVPEDISGLQIGMRVLVPFGKRTITGVVVDFQKETNLTSIKKIMDVLDKKPLVNPQLMNLTKWISEYYLSSYGQAIQLALPKGLDIEGKEIIHLKQIEMDGDLTERQSELYRLIVTEPDRPKSYYYKKFGHGNFYYFLNILEDKGLISREATLNEARVKKVFRKYVLVSNTYPEKKSGHDDYLRYIKKRPEIDQYMMDSLGKKILMSDFLKETKMAGETLQKMSRYDLCEIADLPHERRPEFSYHEAKKKIILTDEQQAAVSALKKSLDKNAFCTHLLHGVTGSGKTQVYIEILKAVINRGQNAIILIPEIALTPQTVARFKAVFENEVAVFNSRMTAGERYDAWMACYHNKVRVVVGPRSALFVPLENIGLIVVDEEQESTYKQSDTVPRYHARDVAIYYAKMIGATVILGSATPSLETYYNAGNGKYQLHEIRNRVANIKLPTVYIIDMRTKRARIEKKITLFSKMLIDKIKDRLDKKEQIILLQNRRGHSPFTQCKDCGFIPACPNCDVTLTYHSYDEHLQCHFCGHRQSSFTDCPNCGEQQIVYKGVGTQRIQNELETLLPDCRILRMDQDTTRAKNRHDTILKAFGDGEADILLGTQMIAKGLDFERVTLVGVVSADVGLALPDFRAPERVFQLLTQVAGRSGRRSGSGEVVIQTYMFSHYAIQFAREHDFKGFFSEEMNHRRNFRYPPYVRMIQLMVQGEKISEVIALARETAVKINREVGKFCMILGPAPALMPKMNNLYRWQVTLKPDVAKDPVGARTKRSVRKIITPYISSKNKKLWVVVDVDPMLLI